MQCFGIGSKAVAAVVMGAGDWTALRPQTLFPAGVRDEGDGPAFSIAVFHYHGYPGFAPGIRRKEWRVGSMRRRMK